MTEEEKAYIQEKIMDLMAKALAYQKVASELMTQLYGTPPINIPGLEISRSTKPDPLDNISPN